MFGTAHLQLGEAKCVLAAPAILQSLIQGGVELGQGLLLDWAGLGRWRALCLIQTQQGILQLGPQGCCRRLVLLRLLRGQLELIAGKLEGGGLYAFKQILRPGNDFKAGV